MADREDTELKGGESKTLDQTLIEPLSPRPSILDLWIVRSSIGLCVMRLCRRTSFSRNQSERENQSTKSGSLGVTRPHAPSAVFAWPAHYCCTLFNSCLVFLESPSYTQLSRETLCTPQQQHGKRKQLKPFRTTAGRGTATATALTATTCGGKKRGGEKPPILTAKPTHSKCGRMIWNVSEIVARAELCVLPQLRCSQEQNGRAVHAGQVIR